MKPHRGRPKSENPKIKQLGVRCNKETLEKLDTVASSFKETRVEAIRRSINYLYSLIKER